VRIPDAFFWLWILGASTVVATDLPPYQPGEKLTYHFYWGIFMVGRGTFEVGKGQKDGNYVFSFHGKSNNFISSIYPVDDALTSVFDINQRRSINFIQDRKEGDHHVWEETFFFYQLRMGSTESYISGEKKWFNIPAEGVQDKLSTIYYMRCLDWTTRDDASTLLGNDKENFDVKITRLKTERVELDDFVPIPTFQVEPNTEYLSGFVKKGKMLVWVSDDRFKIPVRVVSKLSFGTVSAVLVKVEGVKDWPYDPKD